jgi:hypothetical protein
MFNILQFYVFVASKSDVRFGLVPKIAHQLWSPWRAGLVSQNPLTIQSISALKSLIVELILYGPVRDHDKDSMALDGIVAWSLRGGEQDADYYIE